MKEKVKPNPRETRTQDAESVAESIQENPKMAPNVDFDSDYELAQKMSHSAAEDEPTAENEKSSQS